jgi:hypothetical protein
MNSATGGAVCQPYARLNYIPQSETKNLAVADDGVGVQICEKIMEVYDDNYEDCTTMIMNEIICY